MPHTTHAPVNWSIVNEFKCVLLCVCVCVIKFGSIGTATQGVYELLYECACSRVQGVRVQPCIPDPVCVRG
jgi:hypothetical protein